MKIKDLNNGLLTVEEFANKLKVHPHTVRSAIKKGHISAFRVNTGSRSPFRIPSSEIYRMAEVNLEEVIKGLTK